MWRDPKPEAKGRRETLLVKVGLKKAPKQRLLQSHQAGFSLVEMSLVLILVGSILTLASNALRSYHQSWQRQITREHQKLVLQALEHYFMQNGCLPCPALPGENKGKARPYCAKETSVGIVPFRTLGLSEKIARDGFHRWMTYGVDWGLTTPIKGLRLTLCAYVFSLKRTIRLRVGAQDVSQDLVQGDGVACTLISHGPTGWGSFQENGERYMPTQIAVGISKRRNTRNTCKFYATPSPGEVGLFDDIVVWVTRGNLMKGAGINCADYFFPPKDPVPPPFSVVPVVPTQKSQNAPQKSFFPE